MKFIRDVFLPKNLSISRMALAHVFSFLLIKAPDDYKITKKDGKDVTQFVLNLINKNI